MTTPAIASTVSVRSGDTLIIPMTLDNADSTPVNLAGKTVAFAMYPPNGGTAIALGGSVMVNNPATGSVTYSGTAGDTAQSGEFRGYFLVTTPGFAPIAYPADGILIAIYPLVGSLTGPQVGPCFPWTTADAVRNAVSGIDPAADLTQWITAASEVLHALTGRQFKGLCRATIHPGHESCSCGGLCGAHAWGWPFTGGFSPYAGWGGGWGWGRFAQEGPRNTLLCASEIDLGHDCRTVESIKIDGAEIDASTWRLDPLGKLVRQPDSAGNPLCWPCCSRVDEPSGGPGTFEITYTYGQDPPASVVMAVNVLAGQFWLGSNAGSASQCKLPQHAQTLTRQGLTATFITDITIILSKGFTGLNPVDIVIQAMNPNHLQRRARVIDIDIEPHRWMA